MSVFFYRKINHGFELYKIRCRQKVPFQSFEKPNNLSEIFQQKFYYLDKGTQFYVFESEDKKYVIKFFRFDRMDLPFWTIFSPKHRKMYKEKRGKRLRRLSQACLLASRFFSEESALLYVHSPNSNRFSEKIRIVTPLFKEIAIDPKTVCFTLQKRAISIKNAFSRSKNIDKKKQIIHSFFSHFLQRARHHIVNTDPNFWENFGYVDRIVEFDIGDFIEDGSMIDHQKFQLELNKYAPFFRKWLEKTNPALVSYFDTQYRECLSTHALENK